MPVASSLTVQAEFITPSSPARGDRAVTAHATRAQAPLYSIYSPPISRACCFGLTRCPPPSLSAGPAVHTGWTRTPPSRTACCTTPSAPRPSDDAAEPQVSVPRCLRTLAGWGSRRTARRRGGHWRPCSSACWTPPASPPAQPSPLISGWGTSLFLSLGHFVMTALEKRTEYANLSVPVQPLRGANLAALHRRQPVDGGAVDLFIKDHPVFRNPHIAHCTSLCSRILLCCAGPRLYPVKLLGLNRCISLRRCK